jgi:hypothetical protein
MCVHHSLLKATYVAIETPNFNLLLKDACPMVTFSAQQWTEVSVVGRLHAYHNRIFGLLCVIVVSHTSTNLGLMVCWLYNSLWCSLVVMKYVILHGYLCNFLSLFLVICSYFLAPL